VKVLVTGGAGFIGSHTVQLLLAKGYEVTIVDNLRTGRLFNKEAKFYQVDMCSEDLDQVFQKEKPDFVLHLAAQVSVQESLTDPLTDAQINIMGTLNLLNNSLKYAVEKIVFSSSAAVYGKPEALVLEEHHPAIPISFYGLSKLTAEKYIKMYARHFGLRYTILRYANVYGPNQLLSGEGGVAAIFIEALLNNNIPQIFGTGEQTRDFIFVEDVARSNLAALAFGDAEIFNISTNTATTVNDLLAITNSILNRNISPQYRPAKDGDILHSVLNNTKAKKLLNWAPLYSLSEGLKQTIENWNKHSPKANFTL